MLITHDLGVVAEVCDRVVVMYSGRVMEYTDTKTLFKSPFNPYTIGLMNSIPKINNNNKNGCKLLKELFPGY